MAQEHEAGKSIAELRQEIALSRMRLGRDMGGVRAGLDFPRTLRRSFQRRSVTWIAGAVIVGVVLTARFGSSTQRKVIRVRGGKNNEESPVLKAGLAMTLAKVVGMMVRPLVISFVTKKLRGYASGAHRKP